jgi:hypothetical protein
VHLEAVRQVGFTHQQGLPNQRIGSTQGVDALEGHQLTGGAIYA